MGDADGRLFEEVGVLEGDGAAVGGDGWFAHFAEEAKAVFLGDGKFSCLHKMRNDLYRGEFLQDLHTKYILTDTSGNSKYSPSTAWSYSPGSVCY